MFGIERLIIVAIALVAIWLVFCAWAEPSPKVRQIGNIVLGAIFAILAIKLLMAFV